MRGAIDSIMLTDLPPEILLLIVNHLGYKSHLDLARTCTVFWTQLGVAAQLRYKYADYSCLGTEHPPSLRTPKPADCFFWHEICPYIECLKILTRSESFQPWDWHPRNRSIRDPDSLFWLGRTRETIEQAQQLQHDSKILGCRKLRPSHLVNLRAIDMPITHHNWIPLINSWAATLHIISPFKTLDMLKVSGKEFSFLELKEIVKLPALRHLCIEGPTQSWPNAFENLGSFEAKSSKIETLEIIDSRMSVGSACRLIVACKALACFAFWQRRPPAGDNLVDSVWDSRAIIYTLCEHQSQSMRVLSLHSDSKDMQRAPWIPLKGLPRLESLTSEWLYFVPRHHEYLPQYPPSSERLLSSSRKNFVTLSDILPSSLRRLCLEPLVTRRTYHTDWKPMLIQYITSPDCALEELRLPFSYLSVRNATRNKGIKLEEIQRDGDGTVMFEREPFIYQDVDGRWTTILDL